MTAEGAGISDCHRSQGRPSISTGGRRPAPDPLWGRAGEGRRSSARGRRGRQQGADRWASAPRDARGADRPDAGLSHVLGPGHCLGHSHPRRGAGLHWDAPTPSQGRPSKLPRSGARDRGEGPQGQPLTRSLAAVPLHVARPPGPPPGLGPPGAPAQRRPLHPAPGAPFLTRPVRRRRALWRRHSLSRCECPGCGLCLPWTVSRRRDVGGRVG